MHTTKHLQNTQTHLSISAALSLLFSVSAMAADPIIVDATIESDPAITAEENLILIQQNILDSLNEIPVNERTEVQSDLLNVLSAVSSASESEKNTFYGELSAKKSATSSNVTRKVPTTVTISGIGKRLSALRGEIQRTSFSQHFNKRRTIDRNKARNKSRENGNYSLPIIFNQSNDDLPGGLLDQRLSGFVSGNFTVSKQSETSTESGFDGSSQQLTGGADYRINNQTFAGLALGIVNSNMDINNNGGTLKNKAATLLAYGTYSIKPNWYAEGTLSTGKRNFDMNRAITFTLNANTTPTTVSTSACSEPSSGFLGLSLGTGYDRTFPNGHTLAALASFNYTSSTIDSFTESGCTSAIPYTLVIGEQKITSKMLTVGGQWTQAISTGFGILIPQFSINWITELEDKSDAITAYFSNDPGQNTMSFKSGNKDLSFVNVKLAVSTILPRGISGFFQYETQQFVDDYQQYTVSIGARKEF